MVKSSVKFRVSEKIVTADYTRGIRNIDTGNSYDIDTGEIGVVVRLHQNGSETNYLVMFPNIKDYDTGEPIKVWTSECMLKPAVALNKNRHEYKICTAHEMAPIIADLFIWHEVSAIYIAGNFNPENTDDVDDCGGWRKIIEVNLPFDNLDNELCLMIGYCGGGNVAIAYDDNIEDPGTIPFFIRGIEDMINESTGGESGEMYMEIIRKIDKHSYETDKEDK